MVKIMESKNGVEVSVFDNTFSPFTLDLYMRRFIGEKKRIQAFHAELTPNQARELISDLELKIKQCEDRHKTMRGSTESIIKGERMSEEQVIISYAIIDRTFEKAGDAKAQWLMIKSISEPAPPKDWRPVCFNYCELIEGCGQIPHADTPECKECPYRNLE